MKKLFLAGLLLITAIAFSQENEISKNTWDIGISYNSSSGEFESDQYALGGFSIHAGYNRMITDYIFIGGDIEFESIVFDDYEIHYDLAGDYNIINEDFTHGGAISVLPNIGIRLDIVSDFYLLGKLSIGVMSMRSFETDFSIVENNQTNDFSLYPDNRSFSSLVALEGGLIYQLNDKGGLKFTVGKFLSTHKFDYTLLLKNTGETAIEREEFNYDQFKFDISYIHFF